MTSNPQGRTTIIVLDDRGERFTIIVTAGHGERPALIVAGDRGKRPVMVVAGDRGKRPVMVVAGDHDGEVRTCRRRQLRRVSGFVAGPTPGPPQL